MGRSLGMAHHYRMLGARTKAPPHTSGSAHPQTGLRKKSKMKSPLGETVGLLKLIERLKKHIERQVGSEGTPHVGHANTITNDEHGSRLDISN